MLAEAGGTPPLPKASGYVEVGALQLFAIGRHGGIHELVLYESALKLDVESDGEGDLSPYRAPIRLSVRGTNLNFDCAEPELLQLAGLVQRVQQLQQEPPKPSLDGRRGLSDAEPDKKANPSLEYDLHASHPSVAIGLTSTHGSTLKYALRDLSLEAKQRAREIPVARSGRRGVNGAPAPVDLNVRFERRLSTCNKRTLTHNFQRCHPSNQVKCKIGEWRSTTRRAYNWPPVEDRNREAPSTSLLGGYSREYDGSDAPILQLDIPSLEKGRAGLKLRPCCGCSPCAVWLSLRAASAGGCVKLWRFLLPIGSFVAMLCCCTVSFPLLWLVWLRELCARACGRCCRRRHKSRPKNNQARRAPQIHNSDMHGLENPSAYPEITSARV